MEHRFYLRFRKWIFAITILVFFEYFYNMFGHYSTPKLKVILKLRERVIPPVYYKYPLKNSTEIPMNFNISANLSSYDWFMSHKKLFKNIGAEEMPVYQKGALGCSLKLNDLGPISVNTSLVDLKWVEQQYPGVRLGGFHAPLLCQPRHRVAILIPYRNRETNLAIFLRHIHPLLQKQLLMYRVFVIEQYGTGQFNKGLLYNIGYLESQRFGDWQCLIFQDVDLIPQHELILYSCPRKPTHMAATVNPYPFTYPYHLKQFGGVTALTVNQYDAVNGYSNMYLDWGAEDNDMFIRIQATRIPVLRYNISIARYVALPHRPSRRSHYRKLLLRFAKRRFRREGLRTSYYKLINVIKRKLFTHIIADVNPSNHNLKTRNKYLEDIFDIE